jgi:gamma-glutamyltranspeptidase/glutathione hydrolase
MQPSPDSGRAGLSGSRLDLAHGGREVGASLGYGGAHAGDHLDSALVELLLDPGVLSLRVPLADTVEDLGCGADQGPRLHVDDRELDLDAETRTGGSVEVHHVARLGPTDSVRGVSREIAATASGPAGSGAVAAGSSATCAAAARMLRMGGSAIDAVVAGAFAATVAEPTLASLGGGGFCISGSPGQVPRVTDFFVDMPGRGSETTLASPMDNLSVTFGSGVQQEFHVGWSSVATPGTLSGLLHLHADGGRLALADVIEPALTAARDGIFLDQVQVDFIRVIGPILALTPASAALFAPPLDGAAFRNPAYAGVLEALSAVTTSPGGSAKPILSGYDEAFAQPLAAAMSEARGLVTLTDLQRYAVMERSPVSARRGSTWIWSNPPPAFGGGIVLETLGLVPSDDPWPAVPSALRDATLRHRAQARREGEVHRGTTHLSVIDKEGCVAALSLSNGSGSGTVATGVALNNMLGEADLHPGGFHSLPAGQRLSSMMAPTLAASDDGSLLALGTGGSERIRSALVQVLVRILDQGQDLADAIRAPRLHAGDVLVDIEPGFPREYVATLAEVRAWPTPDLYFGGVHAVTRDPSGRVTAVADTRRGGAVAVVS